MKKIKALFFIISVYSLFTISGCDGCEGDGCNPPDPFDKKRGEELSRTWILKVGEGKRDNVSIGEWEGLTVAFTYDTEKKQGTYTTERPQSSLVISDRDKIWKAGGTFVFSNPETSEGVNTIYRDGDTTTPVSLSYSDGQIPELAISFTVRGTSNINAHENLRTTSVTGKWNFVFVPKQ